MTKTNTRSRIVSILLVLMMLLTMVPITAVTASAADGFVEVSTYEELRNEVNKGSAKIKLTADIDTTSENSGVGVTTATNLSFKGRGNVLDLNGHKLKLVSNMSVYFIQILGSDLTIKDSGTGGRIDMEYGQTLVGVQRAIVVGYLVGQTKAGSLTVESGTLSSNYKPVILIECFGNLTINGGKLYAPYVEGTIGDYAIHTSHKYNDGAKTIINDGEIDGRVFIERDDSAATGSPNYGDIPEKINGGTFKQIVELRWAKNGSPSGEMTEFSPAVEITGGIFEGGINESLHSSYYGRPIPTKLTGGTFKAEYNFFGLGDGSFNREFYAKSLGNSIIMRGNEIRTSCDWSEADWFNSSSVTLLKGTASNPVRIIPNAWGMKSVTLDGTEINYAKDWKGAVERMDNSTAHTLKFEWYPLAQELKDAGYTYRANFDCYTVGSNIPTTSVPISATATEYSHTIPAGAAPSVYPFDLQLNLDKNGSSVGIMSNQHIVKLVVSEAPVVVPDPTIEGSVYYTSGIVFGRSISTAASVTPAEATKAYQWQRSTNGGSTWTNIDGATRGSYTPVAADMGENVRIRVVVTAEGYLGEIVGAAIKVSKAANNNYPAVIQLEAVKNGAGNYTGFKITNFDSDCEYVYSTTDMPNWSANQISSATVTGLTSDTTYYVFARFKETNTHTAGSIVSNNSIKLYDSVPLDRVLLEGYGSSGTIYIKKGESVTLKVNADPSNANYWNEITFKDEGATTSNIAISNGNIAASTGTATPFPNGHTITITGVSTGSANLRASYPSATSSAYGTWYVVVYDDSTVANALRLESVYAYADITLSENDEAELPTDLPTLLPANSGYHLEWRILKRGTYGATYVTENDNIKLEDGKIKPKAAHAASEKAQLELVAVKDGSTEYKTLPKKSLFYVTVTEAPVIELTGVTVAPTKVNLDLNATYQLSAVKEPVNAAGSLAWESSNPGVATVDSTGKVTAKAQGTAIITVSCGDKKATCTVTVDHQHDYTGQPYLYLDPGNHYQECKLGDGYNIQAHEFTPWTDNGNGTHSRHCTVCKMTDGSTYTETAEHTWVWVVDQEAALGQPGKQHEECTGCHAKRSENTEIPALRDYAVTVTGGTATVAAGTPITRAMEGVEVTVTAQVPDGKHFVKWVVNGVTLANETSATTTFIMPANDVTIEAECAENPVESYTLTVIKGTASVAAGTPITDKVEQNTVVTVTADAPETGKVFDKWVVLEGNVTLTDATKATTTFTMPGNAVKIEATYKDAPPSHTHSYGTDWKYDGTNHWHECQCGDKADTAAHSFQWVIDKAATKEATGIKHEECTVCGAKRSENTVIDKLPDSGNTGNTGSGDNNTNKPGKDDSTKSPQTGDSSNLIGWLAALFVSGGVLTVLGVSSKKRKESEAE